MSHRINIVADSRGGFLQFFLDRHNDNPNVIYSTKTLKGRKLEELWLQAKDMLIARETDHVYIWGGICNLTSPYYAFGRRSLWLLKSVEELTYDLIHILNTIVSEITFLGLDGKVTFMPETGINLLAYNQVEWPADWMLQCQHDMAVNIPFLYAAFKNANFRLGCTSPWIMDTVYGRNKQGLMYPKFSKIYDGLHPSPSTAADMAKKIIITLSFVFLFQLFLLLIMYLTLSSLILLVDCLGGALTLDRR